MGSNCESCAELLRSQRSNPPKPYQEYPQWYREGMQCPECGAGFEGEFGTLEPIKDPEAASNRASNEF